MSRRRPKTDAVAVSLFPFLAVLLCTMGALIVLLVMLSLQAKDTVQAAPPPHAPEVDDDEIARYEALQTELDQLEADRDALLAQLEARSKVLEDLDIEGTRLEEELESLEALRGQLRNNAASDVSDEELQANLTWYENKLFEKAEQLKEIKRRLAENPVSYAIVPYLGDSGTFRRPLYIECTDEGVILQPEGVILRADDFSVLAANNPLVSAIRETTNYWRSQGRAARGEAYPLLLVRPNGSLAFHAAKTALEFWSGDFGYELVDEDWSLEFSDPDPVLAQRQARAIDNARSVLVNLRRGGSGLLSQATRPSFRVATQGSLEQVSPGTGGEGDGNGFGASAGSNSSGTGTSQGNPYEAGPGSQGSGDHSQLAGGGNRNGADLIGSDGSRNGDSLLGTPNGTSQGDPLAPMFGGANNPNGAGSGGTGGFGHQPNRVTGGQVPGQGNDGPTNYVGMANPANDSAWRQNGAGPHGSSQNGASQSGAMQPGSASSAMQPGSLTGQVTSAGTPQMPGAVGQSGTSFSQSGTGMQSGIASSSGASGAAAGGASSAMQNGNFSFSNSSPGASGSGGGGGAHREDNWALPNIGIGEVAVSRMMRVTLDANTLTIYPKDRQWKPEVVRLQTQTEQSLDDFRAAVWREMDRWGTAGQGMYWKPILKFEVTPDGADRYFELKRLMENSGFVLESQRVLPAQRAAQPNILPQGRGHTQQPPSQGPLIIRPAENFTGNRGTRR